MDKLAEHVGLYDVWTVFFPGIVGVLETIYFIGAVRVVYNCGGFKEIMTLIPNTVSEWIVVIVFSVFFGLTFQEGGRKVREVFKLKNATKDIFKPGTNLFEEKEIASLKRVLMKKGWDDQSAFNWINAEAQEKGIASKYAKLSVIQNMSIALAAVMLIEAVESVILLTLSILKSSKNMMIVSGATTALSIIMMIMFIKRSERFNRYWVKNLVYAMAVFNTGRKESGHDKPHKDD